jgi:hypothetical protein
VGARVAAVWAPGRRAAVARAAGAAGPKRVPAGMLVLAVGRKPRLQRC